MNTQVRHNEGGAAPVKELTVAIATWALDHGGDGAHLKPGLWSGVTEQVDDLGPLTVHANPHPVACGRLQPYTFEVTSDRLVAICLCSPFGGSMMGFSEDALISHFKAQPSPALTPES